MLRSSFTVRILASALLASSALAIPPGCGARSSLSSPAPVPSNVFCGRASYNGGFAGLSIYVLLDQSASMADDGKWDSVTAAIGSFAGSPEAAGIGMGMQFFPLGDSCSDTTYATPAAPIQLLPTNAAVIQAALAAHQPHGDTPTVPALRGAIEYARASMIADPTREVLVVLATDGDPDDCSSDVQGVAAVAAAGVSGQPQVLTAVIGIENADTTALDTMASAGGLGAPIPVGSGTGAAQQFVDALRTLRDNAVSCRYAVPPTPGASPVQTDIAVSTTTAPGAKPAEIKLVAGLPGCAAGGFYVDDPEAPAAVTLCPDTCQAVHEASGSTVEVSAGCGAGSPPPGTPVAGDGGTCDSTVDFQCVPECGSTVPAVEPECIASNWVCGAGLVSTATCSECLPVPHGCCKADGSIADGSCIDGTWQCPPGAQLFGTGTCKPPAACAATLPCALTDYCKVPDASCGKGSLAGSCQTIPASCSGGGPPVCGCDGQTHASACAASLAGVDVSASGACAAPAGTFPCGPLFCQISGEVCRKVPSSPPAYACVTAPPGCPTGCNCDLCPTCPTKMCADVCTQDPSTGGAILTCEQI
jgi:hypothetical protein